MGTRSLRKCRHCGVWFRPDPRNGHHQRFCTEPACRAASKRASQREWLRKNPDYFRGPTQVGRVQTWRREHPGYWKKGVRREAGGPPDALQEVLIAKGFDREQVSTLRNCLHEEISRPLQDVLSAQESAIAGLVALFSGDALQDDIARILRVCYERGRCMRGVVPWMASNQEDKYESTRADHARTPGSVPVQLG